MYIRLAFESDQQIEEKEVAKLQSILADKVEWSRVFQDVNTKVYDTFSSWSQTTDPEEAKILDDKGNPKKKLVVATTLVELTTSKEYIADFETFITAFPNLKIKMRGMPPSPVQNYSTMVQNLLDLKEKFDNVINRFDQQLEINETCNVHVSNFALLNINQIGLLENGCSDTLQSCLDNGWRILAVMVQPQRRPDYILGKYVEEPDRKAIRL